MAQTQIVIANQTLSLRLSGEGPGRGTLVRLNDGLEGSFSNCECLLHLLEGMIGRRAWLAHQDQIVATVATICDCA
jgi:hypothetical protein